MKEHTKQSEATVVRFRPARAWADKVAVEYDMGLRTGAEHLAAEQAYRSAASALRDESLDPSTQAG